MKTANITARFQGQLTIARAAALLATLSDEEQAVLGQLAGDAEISGTLGAAADYVVVSRDAVPAGRKQVRRTYERVAGLVPVLRGLRARGWVRHETLKDDHFGHFFLTDNAERVWGLRR